MILPRACCPPLSYPPSAPPGQTFIINIPNSEFWAEMSLTVNVEIVTKHFDQAVDLFAQTILKDARGCQGSNRLLLRSLKIEYPYGYVSYLHLHQSLSPHTPH